MRSHRSISRLAFDAALRNAFTLSKRWLAAPPVVMKNLVLDIVEKVTIAANRIDIWLNRAKIAAALEAGGGSQRPDIDSITLSIEAKLRRAGKGKRLVIENCAEAEVNAGLVELIKEAILSWPVPRARLALLRVRHLHATDITQPCALRLRAYQAAGSAGSWLRVDAHGPTHHCRFTFCERAWI
jgi:hypothetical protein